MVRYDKLMLFVDNIYLKGSYQMKQQRLIKVLTYCYLIPLAIMVIFNTVNSLLRITYFELYKDMETAKYKWDNPLLILLFTVLLFAVLYIIQKSAFIKKVNTRKICVCFAGLTSLFIVLLFRCIATCDSEHLSQIATQFMQNNYASFEQGEYLYNYSFQLGMAALLEVIYRIFGIENFIVFQLLNVISIMIIIWMMNKITAKLFEHEQICKLEALISMGMLPLFLFATFVYGDIIGWAFGVCAIYFIICHLKNDKWQDILKAALLLAVGILVKSNINILVVAAVIAILLNSVSKKKYRLLIWIPILVLISQVGIHMVNHIYVQRAGLSEYPAGIPKIAWIAMSMQETDEGGYACGWYNAYNWNVYRENNFDREATSAACLDNLMQSLNKFAHEQKYALNFFYKKFTSQWNAPTFQCMITNEWATRHVDHTYPLANFFIYGLGRDILYAMMNVYHFFIFLCSAVYFIFGRREWSLTRAYFMLNIFGGFLFHMIWEAQSRYILGYFVLMLPIAACGVHQLLRKLFPLNKLSQDPKSPQTVN